MKSKTTTPILITHAELAGVLGVPRQQVLRWARANASGFPAPVKVVERTYLFDRRKALAWARVGPDA